MRTPDAARTRLVLGSLIGLSVLSACAPDSEFARQVKARRELTAVRMDRDGTVHARHRDGSQLWFTLEDQQSRRFHVRRDGSVKLMVMDPEPLAASVPPGVTEIVVARCGVQYGPSWLSPYPNGEIVPEFGLVDRVRIRGSWTFATPDDTSQVRKFYAAQLAVAGLTPRRGVALKPARDLPVVIDAGKRGGERFFQIRMGPGHEAGAHGEVYYEYRR